MSDTPRSIPARKQQAKSAGATASVCACVNSGSAKARPGAKAPQAEEFGGYDWWSVSISEPFVNRTRAGKSSGSVSGCAGLG